jgi:putative hydrolase of the HAD superfamily
VTFDGAKGGIWLSFVAEDPGAEVFRSEILRFARNDRCTAIIQFEHMDINITTVIFDFGYVLSLPPRTSDYLKLAALADIEWRLFEEVYWGQRADYDRGTIDGAAYWRRVAEAAGREVTAAQIASLIAADIAIWMRANPIMMEWVRALKARGLKIAVLSNMPIEISTHMRQYAPWFREFDYVCFSAEVQLAKPEAAIFQACLNVVGSKPEECLFIDDRAENVEAARAFGMRALQFVSVEQLAVDIQPLNLPPVLNAT